MKQFNEKELNTKYLEIKENYFLSAEFEGEDYKWMSLRNEDIEYLFSLIEKNK
ncbi:hypothetical protein [Metabacillus halosaccharovorans]|uniref:hypothetical protein n=1 Tax=Metabacillus halosaccharovorans TaxID=930124 RepID=UPI0020415127|nr:hypothetical protein [Metabacillus halosaccharovorans]MCM3444386.1 hypothetical protein [Metabacillus halosaccharovorans]